MWVKLCLIKTDGLCDENMQSWGSVVLGVARLICVGGTLGVSSGCEFYLAVLPQFSSLPGKG